MTYKNGAVIVALGEIAMGDEEQWWNDYQLEVKQDLGIEYEFWDERPKNDTIVFDAGGSEEMIKITPDGFYIRGVAVEQGPGEAEAVYKAFREFMTWAILTKPE
jgi:hypothetical protein